MKHYGILQWADFARGVAPEGDRAAMQEHVGVGCSDCSEALAFCEALARVSTVMAGQQAPEA